jgi:hypothetical protein
MGATDPLKVSEVITFQNLAAEKTTKNLKRVTTPFSKARVESLLIPERHGFYITIEHSKANV